MKIISHRGNLNGPQSVVENSPDAIDAAIQLGLDAEIDLWSLNGELFLGHDSPDYRVEIDWLIVRERSLWIHCKNLNGLTHLFHSKAKLNYFYHETDKYTITSLGFVWVFPGNEVPVNGISVMPEKHTSFPESLLKDSVGYGICTDYPRIIQDYLEK